MLDGLLQEILAKVAQAAVKQGSIERLGARKGRLRCTRGCIVDIGSVLANRGGETELRILHEAHFLAVDHNFERITGDKVEDRKEIVWKLWYMQYTAQTQLSKPRRCWLQHDRSHSFTKHYGIVCHPDWCHIRLVLDEPGAMGRHMRRGPCVCNPMCVSHVVVSEHGTMNIGLWTCDMLL
jgi:hypothetical protein